MMSKLKTTFRKLSKSSFRRSRSGWRCASRRCHRGTRGQSPSVRSQRRHFRGWCSCSLQCSSLHGSFQGQRQPVGGSDDLPAGGHNSLSLPHHGNDGSRHNVVDQRPEEGLGGEVRVVLLSEGLLHLHHLHGCHSTHNRQPSTCKHSLLQISYAFITHVKRKDQGKPSYNVHIIFQCCYKTSHHLL